MGVAGAVAGRTGGAVVTAIERAYWAWCWDDLCRAVHNKVRGYPTYGTIPFRVWLEAFEKYECDRRAADHD